MSKSKRGSPRRSQPTASRTSREQVLTRATEDVTDKLREIAHAARQDRRPDAIVANADTMSLGVELRGAQVFDHGLVSEATASSCVEVISIQAAVHPDKTDCINLRIDSWSGHMILTLPRDRAALLVKKLERAVENARSLVSRSRAVATASDPELIISKSTEPTPPRRTGSRKTRRGRTIQRVLEATDQVLDDLLDNASQKTSK